MAVYFSESAVSGSLYIAQGRTGAPNWCAYLIPQGPQWGQLNLTDIWQGGAFSGGSLVFCRQEPSNLTTFLSNFAAWFKTANQWTSPAVLTVVWIHNPDADAASIVGDILPLVTGNPNPTVAASPAAPVALGSNFAVTPTAGAPSVLAVSPAAITIGDGINSAASLTANGQTLQGVAANFTIPLDGPQAGCLQFGYTAAGPGVLDILDIGLRFYTPAAAGAIASLRYPLFDLGSGTLPLWCVLDPTDPLNSNRTVFQVLSGAAPLPSYFRTALGQSLTLTPVSGSTQFVFAAYPTSLLVTPVKPQLTLTPSGKFTAAASGTANGSTIEMLCGLGGAEYFNLQSGIDAIQFTPAQPALATFDPSSPNQTAPANFLTSANGAVTTSWLSISPASVQSTYVSQAERSPLFAPVISSNMPQVLQADGTPFWPQSALPLQATPLAPSAPYAGVTGTSASYVAMESFVLSKARKQALTPAPSLSRLRTAAPGPPVQWGTDPKGLVIGLDANNAWSVVNLAVSAAVDQQQTGATGTLSLTNLSVQTAAALEGDQVFLVATQSAGLFTVSGDIAMDGWAFTVNLTEPDPSAPPILILKFYSRSVQDLVGVISNWSGPTVFNAHPVAAQTQIQAILAAAQADVTKNGQASLYWDFLQTVQDPNWNGVLALNALVDVVPPVIQGALVGVDQSAFRAHHFGMSISDVNPPTSHGVLTINRSSLFGLIDYEGSGKPVPTADPSFQFQVNYLRVQFENSLMLVFQCQIGIAINALFGIPLRLEAGSGTYAPSNMLTLNGSYQAPPPGSGGAGIYSFINTTASTLDFNYANVTGLVTAEILQKLQINQFQFAPSSAAGGQVTSRFSIWGTLVFGSLAANRPTAFDLFNFDQLMFANLGILMTGAQDGSQPLNWQLTTSELTLNQDASTVRSGGLVGGQANPNGLPLKLTAFQYVPAGITLSSPGYTSLALPAGNAPQVAQANLALVYSLNLGTPGTLGSGAPLTAAIVTAWTINGGVLAGIQVTGLGNQSQLDLEGILKVYLNTWALDTVALSRSPTPLVVLRINGCTLQLLGKTFPPTPATLNFLLFAPPPNPTLMWYAAYNPAAAPSQLAAAGPR